MINIDPWINLGHVAICTMDMEILYLKKTQTHKAMNAGETAVIRQGEGSI